MTRKFQENTLLIATHNTGKLEEMRALFAPYGIKLAGAAAYGLAEPPETETTFIGNARIKAHAACSATGIPALADDSGLIVDALDGAPGVYTADWAQTLLGRDFNVAMQKTWDLLQRTDYTPPYTARFCSTLVLAWPDGHDEVFQGYAEGTIAWPKRGAEGHGYDPMFQPLGYTKTFAEIPFEEKNRISHRSNSFAKLMLHCFD